MIRWRPIERPFPGLSSFPPSADYEQECFFLSFRKTTMTKNKPNLQHNADAGRSSKGAKQKASETSRKGYAEGSVKPRDVCESFSFAT
jgi:hypothetical protein